MLPNVCLKSFKQNKRWQKNENLIVFIIQCYNLMF